MTPRPPILLPLCIVLLVLSAGSPASAGSDQLPPMAPLPPVETVCGRCTAPDDVPCKQLYNVFLKNMDLKVDTDRFEVLQSKPMSAANSCSACIPTAFTLELLDYKPNSADPALLDILCRSARKVIVPCQTGNGAAFAGIAPLHSDGMRRFTGHDPDSCSPEKLSIPPTQPPTQPPIQPPQSPSMSLGRKLMLGFGIPLTALGVALLIAVVPKATAIDPSVQSMKTCSYQGFETPCFDPGPAIGLGVAGGVSTAVGIGLIVGGAHRPATAAEKLAPQVADATRTP